MSDNEKRETHADIIAEMRGYSHGMPDAYHVTMRWHDFRVVLARLEAAHRRELKEAEVNAAPLPCVVLKGGNAAKMREALDEAKVGNQIAQWLNGKNYEYEFAYCSACGRMEHAGWDTHLQAKEEIGKFYESYKYCPGCGAKMTGGTYVE